MGKDGVICRPTVQEASTNHHKTPLLTDGLQTVPVVDSHPSVQGFLPFSPVSEGSITERSRPFQESPSVQPINSCGLQTQHNTEASPASPKAPQPFVCQPNDPSSPGACYSPVKEEYASCSSAELPKRLQEFLHSIKNTELESMLDTVDNFEISGLFKSNEDFCWLNQNPTPVKPTDLHARQRSHTEERVHTSSGTLAESTSVNYACPKMGNSSSHFGLAQFHSSSQTNPQYNQGWTHPVHGALYNAYLQPNTFCPNRNNSAYIYQGAPYTDLHPSMNTYNAISHHMSPHRPNDMMTFPRSNSVLFHPGMNNSMSHPRSSNAMSQPRSNNLMSQHRSNNSVMPHSRSNNSVMSHSRSNNVMSPPRSNNAMFQPRSNKGTYHLPIPEVPHTGQGYSGYTQGFTCGQQLNLYL